MRALWAVRRKYRKISSTLEFRKTSNEIEVREEKEIKKESESAGEEIVQVAAYCKLGVRFAVCVRDEEGEGLHLQHTI